MTSRANLASPNQLGWMGLPVGIQLYIGNFRPISIAKEPWIVPRRGLQVSCHVALSFLYERLIVSGCESHSPSNNSDVTVVYRFKGGE